MINFVYNWGNTPKETAWSGTPYGLLTALSRHAKVNEVSLSDTILERGYRNASRAFGLITGKDDFNIVATRIGQKQLERTPVENGPLLMFTEFNTSYLSRSYLYQDLTVDFITRMRNVHSEYSKYTPLLPGISDRTVRIRNDMTRVVNENCKGIFTMSQWLARDLIDNTGISPDAVHAVGGGCNIDVSCIDDSKKEGNRFLYVGKDWERKNGPLVLEAFTKLLSRRNDVHLYIIGPKQVPKEIKLLDSSALDHVHFFGHLSYKELLSYFCLCDYFVMPSKFEAYGLVFGEALIFGLPCIGRNACAMPEFIEEGVSGLLLKTDKVDELVSDMEYMLEHREMVENVKKNRANYIEQYSWDHVAKQIIRVFEEDGFSV